MKLNNTALSDSRFWSDRGYILPKFDRQQMIERTHKAPTWIHFGAGNIFRAFHAMLAQKLLDDGIIDTGVIVAEGYDYEIIERGYRPCDDLSILVTLHADGQTDKTVTASIAESCILDSSRDDEIDRLKEIFAAPSLQMATFTITEKGYSLTDASGELRKDVSADMAEGPGHPSSYIGKVAALLYHRYISGAYPIAMVSTDNCSHNGQKLYDAIMAYAEGWEAHGVIEDGFKAYVSDSSRVSFPWSMIDKITPRPDASVEQTLILDGLEDVTPVETTAHTFIAPFVNAEETEYLVIEDSFPGGRPPLEKAGVIFTDRETVNKVETMKVTTCLNPLHTALAIYGCLLGYTRISDEMKDEELKALVHGIGYDEGLPVVVDPGVIDPRDFIDTVENVRIPNPFMPDTPQRIAMDTSQKLPIRYGETIKSYIRSETLDVSQLKLIPLVFAGWFRYLIAVDDQGQEFTPSPDPKLKSSMSYLEGIRPDGTHTAEELKTALMPLLKDEEIFGVDLVQTGLADTVIGYLVEELAGIGAVRETLKKYTS